MGAIPAAAMLSCNISSCTRTTPAIKPPSSTHFQDHKGTCHCAKCAWHRQPHSQAAARLPAVPTTHDADSSGLPHHASQVLNNGPSYEAARLPSQPVSEAILLPNSVACCSNTPTHTVTKFQGSCCTLSAQLAKMAPSRHTHAVGDLMYWRKCTEEAQT